MAAAQPIIANRHGLSKKINQVSLNTMNTTTTTAATPAAAASSSSSSSSSSAQSSKKRTSQQMIGDVDVDAEPAKEVKLTEEVKEEQTDEKNAVVASAWDHETRDTVMNKMGRYIGMIDDIIKYVFPRCMKTEIRGQVCCNHQDMVTGTDVPSVLEHVPYPGQRWDDVPNCIVDFDKVPVDTIGWVEEGENRYRIHLSHRLLNWFWCEVVVVVKDDKRLVIETRGRISLQSHAIVDWTGTDMHGGRTIYVSFDLRHKRPKTPVLRHHSTKWGEIAYTASSAYAANIPCDTIDIPFSL